MYLTDGPYQGETVSIARAAGGQIPEHIIVGAGDRRGRGAEGLTEHRDIAQRPGAGVRYRYDHADVDNGVWVYRTEPPA